MHTEFLPLLRRMSNLEELTLNLWIDGPQIKHDLLVHLPRLSKFTFHIHNEVQRQRLPPHPLSEEDIQRSFADVTKQPVRCILARVLHGNKKCFHSRRKSSASFHQF